MDASRNRRPLRRRRPALAVLLASFLAIATANGTEAQTRPIIMIDAGHGGSEAGVVYEGLLEKDLVLRMAFTTAEVFVKHGHDVRLTRTGDYVVPGPDRRRMAEEADAALLIMLHTNRNADPNRHGAEIYFSEEVPVSVRAAELFAEALREDGLEVLLVPRQTAFLQSPRVPTVQIEIGFLTNPVERRLLQSEAYHREIAEVYVRSAEQVLAERR
jgi:N-acetylmuramoyl-L-alanine amidase